MFFFSISFYQCHTLDFLSLVRIYGLLSVPTCSQELPSSTPLGPLLGLSFLEFNNTVENVSGLWAFSTGQNVHMNHRTPGLRRAGREVEVDGATEN
jgi:hypothetical protein